MAASDADAFRLARYLGLPLDGVPRDFASDKLREEIYQALMARAFEAVGPSIDITFDDDDDTPDDLAWLLGAPPSM